MERLGKMRTPLRIAYLTDSWGPNPLSRQGAALSRAAGEMGIPFDLLLLDDSVPEEREGTSRRFSLGEVRAAYASPAIVRYLRSERPGVLIVHSGQLGPAAVVAGRLAGVPVVVRETTFTDLETDSVGFRKRVSFRLERLLYRWAALVVAESNDMVGWASGSRGIPRSRIPVWPGSHDIDRIRRLAGEAGPETGEPFRMIAVGRLAKQKGYDVLIEALSIASPDLPDWTLDILGAEEGWKGRWKERIERMVEERGLSDRVRLQGLVDNPYPMMTRADLLVHAARWEHFGNVIVESLAVGTPVLATDCLGGPAEILGDGRFGRLVPSEDPAAFAAALVELASDPEERRRLGEAGRPRADDYSAERLLPGILNDLERFTGVSFGRGQSPD